MTDRTVPIAFVRATVAVGLARGVDTDSLLRHAGISPDLLTHDRARITAEQVAVRVLWLATDDELFGLGPGVVARGTTRLIGLGLIHSPNLVSAVERFREYHRLAPGLPRLSVVRSDGVARLTMDVSELRDRVHLLSPFLLAAAHRMMGWLIGRRIRLDAVELAQPTPDNVGDYQYVFGAPMFFDAQVAAFEFDADLLDAPVVQTEESWLAYIVRAPLDVLSQREYGVADRPGAQRPGPCPERGMALGRRRREGAGDEPPDTASTAGTGGHLDDPDP